MHTLYCRWEAILTDTPTGPSTADRLTALTWIADTVRDLGVVSRPPPMFEGKPWYEHIPEFTETVKEHVGDPTLKESDEERLRWLKSLHSHDAILDYEPRSLAVSPFGTRVAVGTKSGSIQVWQISPEGELESILSTPGLVDQRGSDSRWLHTTLRKPGHGRRRAARLLMFLDEKHLLVGGGTSKPGSGSPNLRVLRLDRKDEVDLRADLPDEFSMHEEALGDPALSERYPRTFFHRLHAVISMIPPGQEVEKQAAGSLLALVLTGSNAVYALSTTKPHSHGPGHPAVAFKLESGTADAFLDLRGGPGEGAGRIVGGSWWRDNTLWVLTERGHLFGGLVSREPVVSEAPADSEAPVSRHRQVLLYAGLKGLSPEDGSFRPPPGGGRMTALKSCWDALVIQAGRYFTLIASKAPPSVGERASPHLDDLEWVRVDNPTDFCAFRPFVGEGDGTQSSPGGQEQTVSGSYLRPSLDAPVWLLVSSEKPGVMWVPWLTRGKRKKDGTIRRGQSIALRQGTASQTAPRLGACVIA